MPILQKRTDTPTPLIDAALARRIRADLAQAHEPDRTFIDQLAAVERAVLAILLALEEK
jgi:hypothetical protein